MEILNIVKDVYEDILHFVAEITVSSLELVGIFIIIVGSITALVRSSKALRKNGEKNVVIELGRALALALEFKMGAEIVKTVIVRDLNELAILAIVIALRTALAVVIHWEIKSERQEEETRNKQENVIMKIDSEEKSG